MDAHFTAKVAAVACLQLVVYRLLGVDRLGLLAFKLAINDSRSLGYSNINLGGQGGFKLFTFDVPLCSLKIRPRIKRPDQAFFGFSALRIWNTSWMMLFAFHLGLRPMISDAAATAIQKTGLARMVSMTGKVVLPKSTAVHATACRLPGGQSRPCVDYIDEELGFVDKRQAKARFRDQILKEWDYKCAYCRGCLGTAGTLDHVRPKSKGGQTSVSNLIAACSNCNIRKSSNDWKHWFRMQEFWQPHLEDAIFCWLSQ